MGSLVKNTEKDAQNIGKTRRHEEKKIDPGRAAVFSFSFFLSFVLF